MGSEGPHHTSTQIIGQRELAVGGVLFQWWAVGEKPALVTVRAPLLGALTEFTNGDIEACALLLANRLLDDQRARAAAVRKQNRPQPPVLKKPGWFQADEIDFSATNF